MLTLAGELGFVLPVKAFVVGVVLVSSGISLALYGTDKASARAGRRRVPESTFHLLSVLGGWPGALVGQRAFRHKTRKRSFQIVFWATVVLNCAAIAAVIAGS